MAEVRNIQIASKDALDVAIGIYKSVSPVIESASGIVMPKARWEALCQAMDTSRPLCIPRQPDYGDDVVGMIHGLPVTLSDKHDLVRVQDADGNDVLLTSFIESAE